MYPHECTTGYNVRGMRREANKHKAQPNALLGFETHSGAFKKRSGKMAVQSARCYEAFDLGLGHWAEEPEETSVQPPPPKKRLRLSLGKEARPLREHHKSEPVSTAELENAAKGPSSSTDSVPSDLFVDKP